jgi:hypothetical protein
MIDKINVAEIVKGHLSTLTNTNDEFALGDYLLFCGVPLAAAVAMAVFQHPVTADLTTLLVTFGSILAPLLLSVLVLVFDQENKHLSPPLSEVANVARRMKLLKQLYHNVCFCILASVVLVVVCLVHTLLNTWMVCGVKVADVVTGPLAILIASNLLLSILMILKRLHRLLT